MSRILVLYGTTDGHTAKVAQSIRDTLRALGASVDIIEAGTTFCRPEDYTGVIVAASVHAGGYQTAVRDWLRAHLDGLGRRPTAFVSVCLGVLQQDPRVQEELATIIDRFLGETGFRPTVTKMVAGALLYTRYNWIKRWAMRRIVRKAGGDIDTSRDYEYTDWNDLRVFAEQFAQRVTASTVPGHGPDAMRATQVA
jgi:menaquinone-dependent protoporphyrinogen oxidase